MTTELYHDELVFLAHSVALEQEAAERLQELAHTMEAHNNPELRDLLMELADYSAAHADEVCRLCGGRNLPRLNAWEYSWPAEEAPESFHYAKVHYLMSTEQALQVALEVEQNAQLFYADVAQGADNHSLQLLAERFAREEQEHVQQLRQRLQQLRTSPHSLNKTDFDPPSMPE